MGKQAVNTLRTKVAGGRHAAGGGKHSSGPAWQGMSAWQRVQAKAVVQGKGGGRTYDLAEGFGQWGSVVATAFRPGSEATGELVGRIVGVSIGSLWAGFRVARHKAPLIGRVTIGFVGTLSGVTTTRVVGRPVAKARPVYRAGTTPSASKKATTPTVRNRSTNSPSLSGFFPARPKPPRSIAAPRPFVQRKYGVIWI